MSVSRGQRVCFGADPRWLTLPILNLPPRTLRVRRRVRMDCVARAFIRSPEGVTVYILSPDGDGLKLIYPQGANQTDTSFPSFPSVKNPCPSVSSVVAP